MADPYAERKAPAAGSPAPGGAPPWLEALEAHCAIVRRAADIDPAAPRLGIVYPDAGVLAPIARLRADLAALLLADAGGLNGHDLAAALTVFTGYQGKIYLLKHGFVAGPQGADGCFTVDGSLLSTVLKADVAGAVRWERDPDFGYEVAAMVPGVEAPAADALLPRLLYGHHDRVYEHAEHVAETRERWHVGLTGRGQAPAEVLAATGWPPRPTGTAWKD